MAKNDEVQKLRERSRNTALDVLKPRGGLPVPPRTAMRRAQKASKSLPYPVPPYSGVSLMVLGSWAIEEWKSLGKWQSLAAPVIVLVGLLTWEKEKMRREEYWTELEKAELKQKAADVYGAFGPRRKKRLFGMF